VKKYWKYLVALLAVLLLTDVASAQRRGLFGRRNRVEIQPIDTSVVAALPDSVIAYRDSVHRADSIARRDSLELLGKSSLERPAFSTAKDSVVEVFSNGQRIIYYYGDVTVSYQNMKLTADYMEYDMNTGIVYAKGTFDPVTQDWKGRPEMSQDGKTYKMEELRYNFNNQKAVIKNMITQEDDGILQGKDINMAADRSISIMHGMYTVCDLEHPHYYLNLYNAKVITRPTQKTVFGPAWPTFEDVPFPIGIPFGFIPKKPQRATGFLMPTFGEENARGFYFRDMGMYFVIGDYFDLSLTGDLYTLGSWSVDINSRYRVNYKFNGTFGFTYSNDQTGERGSTDFFQSRNFGLKWSHSQDSKAHPGTSFTASVNFSSPSNSRYNSRSVTEALQNQISSSISYSRNWNGKVNLSVNALHNQNSRDSSYSFTLPNISLSVNRFYPFKRQNRVGKERFYEKISLGYNTAFQNRVNFKMSELQEYVYNADGSVVIDPATGLPTKAFADVPAKLLNKMTNGMNHNFQIGLPNFSLLNYLNFTPSVSYGMNWLFSSGKRYLRGVVDEAGNPVMVVPSEDPGGAPVQAMEVITEQGEAFNHFGMTHTYSGSISMNTRIYGMYNFGKHRRVQALRHVITPSMSANFRPEQGTSFNGWRTLDAYYDKDGRFHEASDYNIYSLSTHNSSSAPGKGKTAGLSFSLGNNLEAKVRDIRDTTGTGSKKIKIIDQLNLNGSYNFLADSLKMSNIGVSMSTSVFGKLGLNANANFDPYAIDERGKKINTFNIVKEGWAHPLRLTNASVSLSYSMNGKGAIEGNDGGKTAGGDASGAGAGGSSGGSAADAYKRIYYHPITGEYIPGGYLYYMNPNVPWSFNLSYSFNYSRNYQFTNNQLVTNNRFTQTVQFSGNVKLTPRMNIQMTSGFDVMAMKLTTTQISATYDLHCFNISVSWVPTGNWQSYSFRIAANAAALADLLRFKKSSSYMDNMLGY
jgi:hypothetical protein